MKFSDALAAEESTFRKGPVCGVKTLMARLDKDDAAAFQAALASDTPHAFIVRALASIGVKLPAQTIARHRKGDCSCG